MRCSQVVHEPPHVANSWPTARPSPATTSARAGRHPCTFRLRFPEGKESRATAECGFRRMRQSGTDPRASIRAPALLRDATALAATCDFSWLRACHTVASGAHARPFRLLRSNFCWQPALHMISESLTSKDQENPTTTWSGRTSGENEIETRAADHNVLALYCRKLVLINIDLRC